MARRKNVHRVGGHKGITVQSNILPDENGNRDERRYSAALAKKDPRVVDDFVGKMTSIPNWETIPAKILGVQLSLHPSRAEAIRAIVLADPVFQKSQAEQ